MSFKLLIILLIVMFGCGSRQSVYPEVEIHTKQGDIIIELYPEQAPESVAAFLLNVDSGYYKNSSFYRVLTVSNQPSNSGKAEFIQGGLWKTNYKKSRESPRVKHESTQQTKLKHTDGTISLARQEPGTAGTEFFIVIGDQPGLDYGGVNNPDGKGYAAFGKVIKGMKIVHKIQSQPEYNQHFDPPVSIYDITRR